MEMVSANSKRGGSRTQGLRRVSALGWLALFRALGFRLSGFRGFGLRGLLLSRFRAWGLGV